MRPAALVCVCLADGFADALFCARAAGVPATVVVADGAGPVDGEGVAVLTGADVAGDALDVLAGGLEGDALVAALLPFALARAPRPAVGVTRGLDELPEVDGGSAVTVLAAEGEPVGEPGFVVVGEGAEQVLAWWQARAFEDGPDLDAAMARFDTVRLVHDDALRRRLRDGWDRRPDVASPPARDLAHLPDGTPLDPRLRKLFRVGVQAGELSRGPFEEAGATAFMRWLAEADPRTQMGGVSRLLAAYWEEHDDLRGAYPDLLDAGARAGFVGWIAHHGADRLGLPARALPDLPPPRPDKPRRQLGVNVAGYFQSEAGVGEAARRVVRALDAARVPNLPVQGDLVPATRRGHGFAATALDAAPFDVNLVCVNADGLPHFAGEAGARFFDGRYTIGLWWWELPTFPDRYAAAVERVDEIWVGSRYVQDAIAPAVTVPVVRMPLAVEAPQITPRTRADLGLPDGFLLLFMFDFHSVMERKNPLGLIEAFSRAFAPGDGAALAIKTINAAHHPAAARRLAQAAAAHPDVHVIDRFVDPADRDAMVASADAYVSLHRSEGFGLTIAEALALGKPVIATDYAGSADFLDARTGWPIPHELVPVGPGNEPYDADARWAQPDLDAAAAAMRQLRADPEGAKERGARAAARIRHDHAPAAVGAAMRARLEALRPTIEARAHKPHQPAPSLRRRLARLTTDGALIDELDRARTAHGALTASLLAEQRRLEAEVAALRRAVDELSASRAPEPPATPS